MTASLLRTGFSGKKGPFSRIAWRVYHADVSKLYQKYEQIVNSRIQRSPEPPGCFSYPGQPDAQAVLDILIGKPVPHSVVVLQ